MKWKLRFALLLVLVAALAASTALADTKWVHTPNGKTVNLRQGPSLDDPILTRVPYGAAVEVIYDILGSSFLHCRYNGYDGYIQARYLMDARPADPKPSGGGGGGGSSSGGTSDAHAYKGMRPSLYMASVVPANPSTYVNMRWAPSLEAVVHDVYYNGEPLLVIAVGSEWSQVYDLEKNTCGFMMNRFLKYNGEYHGSVGAAN